MFSDVFSFVVSIYCMNLVKKKSSLAYSFGYHRAETVGALVSVLIVCVITGGLVLEAIQRLIHPADIDGKLMFIIATTGIGFNILLLLTLGHDHHHHMGGSCSHHDHNHHCGPSPSRNVECVTVQSASQDDGANHANLQGHSVSGAEDEHLISVHPSSHAGGSHPGACGHSHCDGHHEDHDNQNLRGAIIHVLGDILQSVGVAIAGAIIWCVFVMHLRIVLSDAGVTQSTIDVESHIIHWA